MRYASRSTCPLSADRFITQLEITTSTLSTGSGMASTTAGFYHSMRLQGNAACPALYPGDDRRDGIDYSFAGRESILPVLFAFSSCYALSGLRARMNALTNFPSTSARSVSESSASEALAPLFAMSSNA